MATKRTKTSPRKQPPGWTVTTYRLRNEQIEALKGAAAEVAAERGGHADASAVLRDIIDAWMKRRARAETPR